MKLSCLQENLAEGLGVVGRVVPTKTTLPVLSNVLLATDNGQLRLSATNLEVAISYWVGAMIEEEGSITLPARLLADFVGQLPRDKVEMAVAPRSTTMALRCGRFSANIRGIDAEDFPTIPSVSGGATCQVEARTLKECIGQVVFAAAADDSRPVLAGVLVTLSGDRITLAAADGFRLAVRSAALARPVEADLSLLVPARTFQELARALPDGEEDLVEIAATPSRNQALFRCGRVEVVSRLIEGQFPDYKRIIPTSYSTRVVVNTADFLQAARAASVFAKDNSNIVRLAIAPGHEELVPGRMAVSGSSAEMGDNEGELDASVEGEEMQIAFNGRYLRDALEAVTTPQVGLEITGPASPGLIRPVGANGSPNHDAYLQVIMPMHIAR